MKKAILFSFLIITFMLSVTVMAQSQNKGGPIQDLIEVINNTINNIRNDISSLFQKTSDLQHQVDIIDLTPGPQGPQGEPGLQGEKGDKGDQGLPSNITVIVEHNMSDLQALLSQIGSSGSQQQSFFDVFMKIGDIKGESTDDKHKEWIEVESFSHGMSNTGTANVGGGAGAGKVSHQDFSIVKKLDKASPELYLDVSDGKHIPEVIIEVVRAGGDKQKYMEYKLTDVIITSVQISGAPSESRPIEQISLNYAKIEWTYTEFDEAGKPKGDVKAGWDVAANKKV